jgi:hypothetical protein
MHILCGATESKAGMDIVGGGTCIYGRWGANRDSMQSPSTWAIEFSAIQKGDGQDHVAGVLFHIWVDFEGRFGSRFSDGDPLMVGEMDRYPYLFLVTIILFWYPDLCPPRVNCVEGFGMVSNTW